MNENGKILNKLQQRKLKHARENSLEAVGGSTNHGCVHCRIL